MSESKRTPADLIKYRLQYVYYHNESLLDKFRQKGKDVSEQELKQSYLAEGNVFNTNHKLYGKMKVEVKDLYFKYSGVLSVSCVIIECDFINELSGQGVINNGVNVDFRPSAKNDYNYKEIKVIK